MKSLFFALALTLCFPLLGKNTVITYLSTGLRASLRPANTPITPGTTTSTSGTTFLSVPLALTNPGPNSAPQIAVSDNGSAVAIWTNFPNQIEIQGAFLNMPNPITGTAIPTFRTFCSTTVGPPCWTPLNVHPSPPVPSGCIAPTFTPFSVTPAQSPSIAFGSTPRVAIDGNGNSMVVFVSSTNTIFAMYFQKQNLKSVTQLSAPGTSNISPTVAMSAAGVAVAVWIQNVPFQVLARSFAPSTNPCGGTWSVNPSTVNVTTPPVRTTATSAVIFLPNSGFPNGTFPAGFGLGTVATPPGAPPVTVGTAIWADGPTGIINVDSFTVTDP